MQRLFQVVIGIMFILTMNIELNAAEAGEEAAELTLSTLSLQQDPTQVSLSEYQGKIVYLDFWASWCPPCLVSMPIMNEMRNRLQGQGIPFEVIAVNVDSDPEDGLDFLFDKPVDFVVLSDPEGETPARYEIKGMPTSFLISPAGIITLKHEGFKQSDAAMIETEILRLVELL